MAVAALKLHGLRPHRAAASVLHGLMAVAALKRCRDRVGSRQGQASSPRPHGRGRIEARQRPAPFILPILVLHGLMAVAALKQSPPCRPPSRSKVLHGLMAVAALKLVSARATSTCTAVLHGLMAVAALKHASPRSTPAALPGRSPRPHGRGRIEASAPSSHEHCP